MKARKRTVFSRHLNCEKELFLPLSGSKYTVDSAGHLFDRSGKDIPIETDTEGNKIAKIDWFDGYRYYLLSEVIAHTFKPLKLHFSWWKHIRVIFADNDLQNLHPKNLVWKFPIGLGEKKFNGFAFIPMFSRYMINREGVLFDTRLKRIVEGHYNVGYHSYVIMPDIGERTSLKRHRGICLAFKDYPSNVDSMDVNHINGITTDDSFDNLEWCTPSENIKHAFKMGLRKAELTPVCVRDVKTGKVTEYESIVSCAKSLNVPSSLVIGRIRMPTTRLNPDGLQFKRKSDLVPWYIPKENEMALDNLSWKKTVLLLNLNTKEVTVFPTQRELSDFFGFVESVFSRWLREGRQRVYKKGDAYYLAKRSSDPAPWREIDDPKRDYLINTLKLRPVLLKNVETGIITEYPSCVECSKAIGILTTTLNYRLTHKGQKIFEDGTQVKYVDEPLPFSNKDETVISILSSAPYDSNLVRKPL